MAFLNIFKKKKKVKERKQVKEVKKKKKEVQKIETAELKSAKKSAKRSKAYRILKKPHIAEKATDLSGKNQYVFKIFESANKSEVKKAVESVFGVNVLSVRIIKVPKKRRKRGVIRGWKKGYKKAIVTIKKGQKIEILPR